MKAIIKVEDITGDCFYLAEEQKYPSNISLVQRFLREEREERLLTGGTEWVLPEYQRLNCLSKIVYQKKEMQFCR